MADKQQTAVIKESLRITPGVASPLLRVVPASGATIDGAKVPAFVSLTTNSATQQPADYYLDCRWYERDLRPQL
jgi:hypothetical protein